MKLKTHQSIAKRYLVTKRGKVLKRKNGQGHFNSGEQGKVTRMKRRDVSLNAVYTKTVKQAVQG